MSAISNYRGPVRNTSREGVHEPPAPRAAIPAPMIAAVPRMRIQLWCFCGRSTGVSLVSIGLSTVLLREFSANVLPGCVTRRGRVCEQGHVAETMTTTTTKIMLICRFIIL